MKRLKPGILSLFLFGLLCLPLSQLSVFQRIEGELYDSQVGVTRLLQGEPAQSSELAVLALDREAFEAGFTRADLDQASEAIEGYSTVLQSGELAPYLPVDPDGVLRGVKLVKFDPEGHPNFAPPLLDLVHYRGLDPSSIRLHGSHLQFGDDTFQLDSEYKIYPLFPRSMTSTGYGNGIFKVIQIDNFLSGHKTYLSPYIPESLSRLNEVAPLLKDRITLLDTFLNDANAIELSTPGGQLRRLELHGTTLNALLTQQYLTPLSTFTNLALAGLFLFGLSLVLPGKSVSNSLGYFGLFCVSWLFLHQGFFLLGRFGQQAPALLSATLVLTFHFFLRVQTIGNLVYGFGGYKAVSEQEKEVEATICFTNLPKLIKDLESGQPELAQSARVAYSDCLGHVVSKHGGRLIDQQGDAQMLAFGLEGEARHRVRALCCALEIVESVNELLLGHLPANLDDLREAGAHCGVVSGPVAFGQIGSGDFHSVAAIGDTTNSAARLMGQAVEKNVGVLTTRETLSGLGPRILHKNVGHLTVRGREQALEVEQVLKIEHPPQPYISRPNVKPPRVPLALLLVGALFCPLLANGFRALVPLESNLMNAVARTESCDVLWAGLDEESLQTQPWPWPRSLHAKIIENCVQAKVKILFLDMLFENPTEPEEDEALVEAVAQNKNVLVAAASLPDTKMITEDPNDSLSPRLLPKLQATGQWGLINHAITIESDAMRYGLWQVKPFADAPDLPGFGIAQSVCRTVSPELVDKLQGQERFIIRWAPPPKKFSYHRLLNPKDPILDELEGKVVVVGDALQGPSDAFDTPMGKLKGAEIHAQAINTILKDKVLTDYSGTWQTFLLSTLLALALIALTLKLPGLGQQLLLGVASLLLVLVFIFKLTDLGCFLGLMPLLVVPNSFLAAVVLRIFDVSKALGTYVSPSLQRRLERGETVEDKTLHGTVLVTDIRGYTALSEGRDPVEVLRLLNVYHKLSAEYYEKLGGHLLTYQGDAQIVVFGALQPVAEPTLQAFTAARQLHRIADRVAEEAQLEPGSIRVGAGIATGILTLSLIKAANQLQYTVVGEPVRRAHDLQSYSDRLGSDIILDDVSYYKVRETMACNMYQTPFGERIYTPK